MGYDDESLWVLNGNRRTIAPRKRREEYRMVARRTLMAVVMALAAFYLVQLGGIGAAVEGSSGECIAKAIQAGLSVLN